MKNSLPIQIEELQRKQDCIRQQLRDLDEQCSQIDQDLTQLKSQAIREENNISAPALSSQDSPHHDPPPLPAGFPFLLEDEAPLETLETSTPATHSTQKTSKSPKSDFEPSTPQRKKTSKKTPKKSTASQNIGDWELNFGQVWLVRIGVVFLLTGLVFLSTYAYKNWLFHSGPSVKVAFFMIVSLSLTGVGLWLDHWKTSYRQYGRVIASGGLAAGYYTLYAAHFTPSLQIIDSPVIAGVFLTLWAGVMLSYAVWKRSRIVAVMAIGLAFYGTVINPAGGLSLFSSLLLSAAGMGLLLKFRWVGIGLSTVIAAYVAHAFWLGYYPQPVSESLRLSYLACYWVMFTAALAVPQTRNLTLRVQRSICAINNSAAWALTVFLIPSFTPHAQIGWISIGMGAFWLLIAAAIHVTILKGNWAKNKLIPHLDPALAIIFGYQGVLIVSLGILLVATGYTRFLILSVEACILLAGACYFGGKWARLASLLTFFCALYTATPTAVISSATLTDPPAWPSYAALALICAVYTMLVRRDQELSKNFRAALPQLPAAIFWIVLAWGVFGQCHPNINILGLWIAVTGVMLAYFLTKRPWWLADIAQFSIIPAIGAGVWLINKAHFISLPESILPIAGASSFWFMAPRLTQAWAQTWIQTTQHPQKSPPSKSDLSSPSNSTDNTVLEWIFGLLTWSMLAMALDAHLSSQTQWMWLGGTLAILGHGIAHITGRKSIGVPAIAFHLLAVAGLAHYLFKSDNEWVTWMPLLGLLIHLALADLLWPVLNQKIMRRLLSLALLVSVTLYAGANLMNQMHPMIGAFTLTALGAGLSLWAHWRNDRIFALISAGPALGLACIISTSMLDSSWGRYVPILTTLGIHAYLWAKKSDPNSWAWLRALYLATGMISLMITSSLHVRSAFEGSGLSICWAILSMIVFGLGLLMRCRPYRLIGLSWLAAAVVHVIRVDVMKLESLGRILSFITLGIVLLILGFLYNRFQESIRKFL